MGKEKMTWRSFADDGSIVGTWNLPGTPTFYVIDHRGVIRHKWVGSPGEEAIDKALEKLLKEAQADARK
jgi:peroxiredoxin